jgi:hypothetical protein
MSSTLLRVHTRMMDIMTDSTMNSTEVFGNEVLLEWNSMLGIVIIRAYRGQH